MNEDLYKRTIPIAITVIIGFSALGNFVLDFPILEAIEIQSKEWVVVIAAFAGFLGASSVVMFHGNHLRKQTHNQWQYSVLTFIGLLSYLAVGLPRGPQDALYVEWYKLGPGAIDGTMLGLGAFMGISAIYRAVRGRNIAASLLLIACSVVWLSSSPLGMMIPGIEQISEFILDVPTTAGSRAVLIGAALGSIGLGIRTLLGKEAGFITRLEGE